MPFPVPRPDRAKHPHYGQMHHELKPATLGSSTPEFPRENDVSDMGMTDQHNNNPSETFEPMPVSNGGHTEPPEATPDDETGEGAWETERMPFIENNDRNAPNPTI